MKTDQFDEALRRKFENFQPPYREEDIDRIHGYVKQHIPLSFWQRFGNVFTYSIGTLVIVSLITTATYQYYENKNLLHKVEELNQKVEQQSDETAKPAYPKTVKAANSGMIPASDGKTAINQANSSALPKQTPTLENNVQQNSVSKPQNAEIQTVDTKKGVAANLKTKAITNTITPEKQPVVEKVEASTVSPITKTELTDQKLSKKESVKSEEKVGIKNAESVAKIQRNSTPSAEPAKTNNQPNGNSGNTLSEQIFKKNLNTAIKETEGSERTRRLTKNKSKVSIEPADVSSDKALKVRSNTPLTANVSYEGQGVAGRSTIEMTEQVYTKSLVVSALKSKGISSEASSMANDLANRELKATAVRQEPFPQQSQSTKIKLPRVSWGTKYAIGLGADVGKGQVGKSLLGEVMISRRLGLNTGLSIANLSPEKFGNEEQFKIKTQKDIRDWHSVSVPPNYRIENIQAKRVLLRVPLYLTYHLPLRNNFGMVFSSGTDFDIRLNEQTTYTHEEPSHVEKKGEFKDVLPIKSFNNWMFSVGIEKSWKQFSVQISPYFAPQLSEVSCRKDVSKVGLLLRGYYRFGK